MNYLKNFYLLISLSVIACSNDNPPPVINDPFFDHTPVFFSDFTTPLITSTNYSESITTAIINHAKKDSSLIIRIVWLNESGMANFIAKKIKNQIKNHIYLTGCCIISKDFLNLNDGIAEVTFLK